MLSNRLEEEIRKIIVKKSDRGPVIKKGPANLSDLKDGESIKRFVNGTIVEYVRYGGELYSMGFSNTSSANRVSRFDTGESLSSTPNWDSGWVAASGGTGSNIDFYHYLGTKYLLMVGYFKYTFGSTEYIFNLNLHTLADENNDHLNSEDVSHGITVHMQSDDKMNLGIADDYVFSHDNTGTFGGVYKEISSGYIRLFCWKFNPTDSIN